MLSKCKSKSGDLVSSISEENEFRYSNWKIARIVIHQFWLTDELLIWIIKIFLKNVWSLFKSKRYQSSTLH